MIPRTARIYRHRGSTIVWNLDRTPRVLWSAPDLSAADHAAGLDPQARDVLWSDWPCLGRIRARRPTRCWP